MANTKYPYTPKKSKRTKTEDTFKYKGSRSQNNLVFTACMTKILDNHNVLDIDGLRTYYQLLKNNKKASLSKCIKEYNYEDFMLN